MYAARSKYRASLKMRQEFLLILSLNIKENSIGGGGKPSTILEVVIGTTPYRGL